jgi:hypothetical protein
MVIDPADESHSTYSFVANNPISRKDPDGQLILFINGQNGGDGASSKYWGNFGEQIVQSYPNEKVFYRDGSIGGWANTLFTLIGLHNLSRNARIAAGYEMGMQEAADIFAYLNLEDSKTIRVATHSMGTAFARGYVKALLDYADENEIKNFRIVEVDVASLQGSDLPAIPGVKTFQLGGDMDKIAWNSDIPGAERIIFEGQTDAWHGIDNYPGDIGADALDGERDYEINK